MRREHLAFSLTVGLAGAVLVAGPAAAQSGAAVTPKLQPPVEVRALSRAFASTAKALQPSVVRIDVESRAPRLARGDRQVPPELERLFERFFGEEFDLPPQGPGRGTGSGVILDGAGNILTNSHVVENATKLTVTLADGTELSARVVGFDKETDVAVVRLESPPKSLVAARMGDSANVEVGEWVLAIGSPLGLDQSVTAGIISGKGRVGKHVVMSGGRTREYIQTDAKINPGNSGGPLVNLDGEVIGINTQINTGPGGAYGFAIPINHARRIAQAIVTDGKVKHAYLGIEIGDVRDGKRLGGNGEPADDRGEVRNAPPRAAWVQKVRQDSPAARAGVRVGDVITQIDAQRIEQAGDVVDYVSSRSVGARVTLSYVRDGRAATVPVVLGELPAQSEVGAAPPANPHPSVGMSLQDLSPEVARPLGLDPDLEGAVITEVVPRSRAARAQPTPLRADDVIIEVDRKPVTGAEDVARALREPSKNGHLLRIRRGGRAQFVTIPAQ